MKMRNLFRKGKRVLFGYLIIILAVFAVIETLLGNFYRISPLSLPESYLTQPMTRIKSRIYPTTTQQPIIAASRNKIFNIPTKPKSHGTIKYPTKPTHKTLSNKIQSNASTFRGATWNTKDFHRKTIDKNCTVLTDASNIKTPFKFYIYDLPAKFNYDIQRHFTDNKKFSFCYNLDFCGMGEELYQLSDNDKTPIDESTGEKGGQRSVRNTHQFALETVIHYKLMHSPYRTKDPNKADMFYIPAYTGLKCLIFDHESHAFINELFEYLEANESNYFNSSLRKPHFSTISKIQREQASEYCPLLRHPKTKDITYFAIEKESNPNWYRSKQIYGRSIIVAPYPSYVHFLNHDKDKTFMDFQRGLRKLNESKFKLKVPQLSERNVVLFLAAGTRRSNFFRAQILDQFLVQTDKGPDEFYKNATNNSQIKTEQIMLRTSECSVKHRTTTIPWMEKSVFCLQPPGDSPTRKSIYDSILSGCIPVLFTDKYKTEYPFQHYLDYESFTYTIDEKLISRYNKSVIDIVKGISEEKTKYLHDNLLRVSKWFQYSVPNDDVLLEDDAVTLLLDELASHYNITNTL
ncbi:uncharacterized protein LOC132759653 [Ruditapes philippinarum]|uniref:uncharacterized protein LOC132759653 n=1 Tax=Ruditapes philippinarum TaxID=129788 RepID=UPI00295BC461|nr:uncharacterized protein LOC132759653 [Ruditapes philippinarum]